MKVEDFKLISNELTSINFSGKRAKGLKSNNLTGEFAIGKLSEEENAKLGIKTSIQITEKGKDSEEELSRLKIEYVSTFEVKNYIMNEFLNDKDSNEIMPYIVNNFIYPDILKYLDITYDNSGIKNTLPRELSFAEVK
ncbi:hypothetical protein [Clostridium vincentii]|uniref:Uncharacterized protein n=1 Tax=Clostridium vincentii TaxID=52704 RepID=A0A2T0B7B7_9CLOT|nr:hypothetical protein [Clostridium vincentii]PRR79776.1 hypothetical protein CLVI_32220 [Clostridium vincentii]